MMKWWVSNFDITISIDVIAVLFGIPNYSNDHVIHFMNICILYAKWFIYCCKQKEEKVFFLSYITILKNVLQLEKVRCKINDEKSFDEKLSRFYELF